MSSLLTRKARPPRSAARRKASRPNLIATGLLLVAVSSALVIVSLGVIDMDEQPFVSIGMLAIGAGSGFTGFDRAGRGFFGATFDAGLWLSTIWMVAIIGAAVLADALPLGEARDASKVLLEPNFLLPSLFSSHPLGTDRLALDLLGGVVYGARISLTVGFGAMLIGMVIGATIGVLGGFFRGRLEWFIDLLSNALLAFPPLILLLGVVAVLKPSVWTVTVSLALLAVPTYIRLAKANTLVYAQKEFVLAARALGGTDWSIIRREILPNVALPVLSYGLVVVPVLIAAEASLSFLGLSIPPPEPTWGNMIAAGQYELASQPHVVLIPGLVLFLTVFSLNRIGDRATRLWDTRQSNI